MPLVGILARLLYFSGYFAERAVRAKNYFWTEISSAKSVLQILMRFFSVDLEWRAVRGKIISFREKILRVAEIPGSWRFAYRYTGFRVLSAFHHVLPFSWLAWTVMVFLNGYPWRFPFSLLGGAKCRWWCKRYDTLVLQERIVVETDCWVALVPFWAVWPYETMLLPKRHVQRLQNLTDAQKEGNLHKVDLQVPWLTVVTNTVSVRETGPKKSTKS